MPTFAWTQGPAALVRALPAALVLVATLLAATRAHADPVRPFLQWHADIYMLHYSDADLGNVTVHTSVGPLKGRDIGVTGVETLGLTV